jgi:uncharacterized protein
MVERLEKAVGATIFTSFVLLRGSAAAFAIEQAAADEVLRASNGYQGSETYVCASGAEVNVVHRFDSGGEAQRWLAGAELAEIDARVRPLLESDPVRSLVLPSVGSGGATSLISTSVRPGFEDRFADWLGRMATAQQSFPGYVGQRVQAPIPGVNDKWESIVAFDSEENLSRWNVSDERRRMLRESEPYVERYDVRPAASAFESWFVDVGRDVPPPSAWKLSAIVLLVLYPVVMLEIFSLNQVIHRLMSSWAAPSATTAVGVFIGNAVSVAVTGFLLIPWASKRLEWWLVPPESMRLRRATQGGLLMLGAYALTVLIFILVIWGNPGVMSWARH